MTRRSLLKLAPALALLLANWRATRGETTLLKGYHIGTGFDANALNQLGADWFCGDDSVLRVIRNTAEHAPYAILNATYVYRVPHDCSVAEVQALQQLPNFRNEYILMNEPDLAGFTHQYTADRVVAAITNIQAADPTRNNKIMLCAGSQSAGTGYVAAVLSLLPYPIRNQIDGLALHFYSGVEPGGLYDESKLRRFLRNFTEYANLVGISKLWLSEWGWDEQANPVRVANCLKRWVAVMEEFPMVKRHNFYGANIADYTKLVDGAGLSGVGTAFKGL
jgi:hypothetical protein